MASKFVPKFSARQEYGTLIVKDSYRFKKYVETLGDKELDLVLSVHREQRSDAQNRYYRGVIVAMIAEHTDHRDDEIHEILRYKFLLKQIEVVPGKFEERVGSTTELNTVEAEEYNKKCRAWAWDFLRLSIPLPNEVDIND